MAPLPLDSDNQRRSPTKTEQAHKTKEYSWQEVAVHNSSATAWMTISGKVYDITEWLDKHPGGRELLLLHAGRDCTESFETYHPFSEKPRQILAKYEIGVVTGNEFPVYKPDSGFYKTCRERVGEYFKTNKIDPKDPFAGFWRMCIVFAFSILSYFGTNGFVSDNMAMKTFFSVMFGVCQALPLLHVMHDSSHAAYSSKHNWWQFVGRFTMDWYAGGSLVSWLNQHVIGHHVYTNVAGADPDLPVELDGDVRRIFGRQTMKPVYAWQHIYLPPLYGVLGLKFRIQDVLETFLKRTNGPVRVNPHSMSDWVLMLLPKAFWAWYRIWIPLCIFNIPTAQFWGLFFLTEFVTGWYLAFNFQVSHVSTECDYPGGEEFVAAFGDEWAVSQVKSSVDYAHGSWIVTFLSGALNYQVTHHLFPSVSQYHYPKIAPIIKEVCKEYGINYVVLPSFKAALLAHFKHIQMMGAQGKRVEVHMG